MALASPLLDEPITGSSPHQQKQQQQASNAPQSSKGAAAATEEGREEEEASSPPGTVLFVGFNQDNGCFACGTDAGFRIFNCDPFKETFRREHNGGVGLVEMLFRCNILAVVGGGASPRFPPNKVMIWDDHLGRCIGELSFRSEVRAVRLKRDRIIVVLEHKIYVYNFADLKLLQQIETTSNPKGLCAVSPSANSSVLVCPGLNKGQVRVEHYGLKKTKFISAHDSSIACFALTLEGKTLATASTKGTLIRIFNTLDGTQLQELRRGADRAEIFSLCFSSNAQWLAVSSDKGTVHVFTLKPPSAAEEQRNVESLPPTTGGSVQVSSGNGNTIGNPVGTSGALSPGGANPGSSFSFLKGVLPKYFSSEWSFAQFRLPEETRAIVAFGPQKNTLVVVGTDGSFYKCAFDPVHGGPVTQLEYRRFLKPEEEVAA